MWAPEDSFERAIEVIDVAIEFANNEYESLLKQSTGQIAWTSHYGATYALAQFLRGAHLAPFNHALREYGYAIEKNMSVDT